MEELLTEELLHKKTPEELTTLLYTACIDNLKQAKIEIDSKKYYNANRLLQKANDILYRLGAGINYEAGPVSDQLEMLYNYIAEKLIQANLQKSTEVIDEIIALLGIIHNAWTEATHNAKETNKVDAKINKKVSAYDLAFTNSYNDVNLKK